MNTTDRGIGIRALIAGTFLQLFLGAIYVWSVFVTPVSVALNWDPAAVKLTMSYMVCFSVIGILIGGRLLIRLNMRVVTLIGGALLAAGMLASSFVGSAQPWLMHITYGVVGGFGMGMAYNAVLTTAQKTLPAKRGLATGISVCAYGFSAVLFAPLVDWMLQSYGVVSTFRILAAVFLLVVLVALPFIGLPKGYGERAATVGGANSGAVSGLKTGQMLRTPQFWLIMASMMLGTATYLIANPSFKTLAAERGLSAAVGTGLVMVAGISNSVGRLVFPALSDLLGRAKTTMLVLGLTAIGGFLLLVTNKNVYLPTAALIAFSYGGYLSIYPTLNVEYFGLKYAGANYGAIMIGFAAGAQFLPIIMSQVSSAPVVFCALGVMALVGFGCMFALSHLGAVRERM
ncbi:MAG: MFS transporter [Actinomycetes bacterium]|nr:MFS transporter [Actinomycetes bacterium]